MKRNTRFWYIKWNGKVPCVYETFGQLAIGNWQLKGEDYIIKDTLVSRAGFHMDHEATTWHHYDANFTWTSDRRPHLHSKYGLNRMIGKGLICSVTLDFSYPSILSLFLGPTINIVLLRFGVKKLCNRRTNKKSNT